MCDLEAAGQLCKAARWRASLEPRVCFGLEGAVKRAANTHRALVGVEAVAGVADGAHQLRHDFLQSLRVHTPPCLAPRRNSCPVKGMRSFVSSLDAMRVAAITK